MLKHYLVLIFITGELCLGIYANLKIYEIDFPGFQNLQTRVVHNHFGLTITGVPVELGLREVKSVFGNWVCAERDKI